MSGARALGFSLLVVTAACRATPGTQAPQPLKPEDGPKAWIAVTYSGGLLNRSLHTYFQTEQYAYVMVGHLGGDGRIRVLYPESPDESGFVRGKKYYHALSKPAYYDAIPSLFSFTMSPYRGAGARHDSYDGRGHGYVFMIASRTPLKYGLLYDYAGWAELEVEGYTYHHDPRYAIRDFADVLSGGAKYTLKFANSMTTNSYDTYAQRAWDCAVLSSLGAFSSGGFWSPWFSSPHGYGMSPARYCGQGRRLQFASGPTFTTALQPVGRTVNPAPSLDRPGRRGLGPRQETPTRSTLTRVSPSSPRDPDGARDVFDRRSRPSYGARRGTTNIDRPSGHEFEPANRARAERTRTESPRSDSPSRASAPDRGASGSTSGSSTSGASSSGGSRSGSQATSSPSERRRPDPQ